MSETTEITDLDREYGVWVSDIPLDTSVQFTSAWWSGAKARQANKPRFTCPYRDVRAWNGAVTFSRAFRRFWLDGWDCADEFAKTVAAPEGDA
jgi:hypothetical protein